METPLDPPKRPLLAAEEVATILNISPHGLRWLHRTGRLRGVRVGRRLQWPAAVVLKYLNSLAE